MNTDLETAIVRILKSDGSTAGTGFIITDDGLIATCAHVIAGAEAADHVNLAFHNTKQKQTARVEEWCDPHAEDIAILRLKKSLPERANPIPIGPSSGLRHRSFRTFGFPEPKLEDGMWGYGTFGDFTEENGYPVLELRSHDVTKGFSGAPIMDDLSGKVVAMVTSFTKPDIYARLATITFATPIESIARILPVLKPALVFFLVPFKPNPDFVGREGDLIRLHEALQRDGTTDKSPVGLTGMAGIGKTQLAVKYVYGYQSDYPEGIFWMNAAEPLSQAFAQLGKQLRPNVSDYSTEEQINAAISYLQKPDSLLVMDNLTDPTQLDHPLSGDIVPAALPCCILFTTRRDAGRFRSVKLDVLPSEPALKLLLRHKSRQPILSPAHPEHKQAEEICRILGYLPIALEVASAHLGRWPEQPLEAYRKDLMRRGALSVIDDPSARSRSSRMRSHHEAAVTATLASQWDDLRIENARLMLYVSSQLPESSTIPIARLGLLAGLSDKDESFFGSPLILALDELKDASMLEQLQKEDVRLHPLIRDFVARQIPEADAFRLSCAANLAAAYEDVATLEDHCIRRGIDVVQEDIIAGLDLVSSALLDRNKKENLERSVQIRLRALLRLLQRESNNLRNVQVGDNPALLVQQLYNQAVIMQIKPVMESAAVVLARKKHPHLLMRWYARSQSPAVERVLSGHKRPVTRVAIPPDGKRAISGTDDGELKVWNLTTGKEEHTIAVHHSSIKAIAIAPDGQHVISSEREDKQLKIWDLATGYVSRTLVGHKKMVRAITVTPDGKRVISASDDWTLKIWDFSTGQEERSLGISEDQFFEWTQYERPLPQGITEQDLWNWRLLGHSDIDTLVGHGDWVLGVAMTPDGQKIISTGDNNRLIIWDLHTGRQEKILRGHSGRVCAVAITPDGLKAVSASDDYTVIVWDLETGEAEWILATHSHWVNSVAITPDGRRAISASMDCTLKVWDVETGREECTLTGHEDYVYWVAVTPDGKRAISASEDRTLRVWDLTVETASSVSPLVRTFTGYNNDVLSVAFTPDGKRAISGCHDGTLKLCNLVTGREERTWVAHERSVSDVAVTPDGQQIISASSDKTLKVWELGTGTLKLILEDTADVNAVALTLDGQQVISASEDNTLKVWDLALGRVIRTLRGHSDSVNDVALTPDGKQVISASDDNTLKVWDLATGRVKLTLSGHERPVIALAVTADGRQIVSISWDRTLRVWNLTTGHLEKTMIEHEEYYTGCIAVTPDGQYAIWGGNHGRLKIWNLVNGQVEQSLKGHYHEVYAIDITIDGQQAVSAGGDKTLRVWDLTTPKEIKLFGHKAPVNAVVVSPEGQRVISVSGWDDIRNLPEADRDNSLKVWELKTGRVESTLLRHTKRIMAAVITLDEQWIISVADDGTMTVWNPITEQIKWSLTGFTMPPMSVTVATDGKRAITVSIDGSLQIWDLVRGCVERTIKAHSGAAFAVAITKQGEAISIGEDHYLRFWDPVRGEIKDEVRLMIPDTANAIFNMAVTPDGRQAVLALSDHTLQVWDLTKKHAVRTLRGHRDRVLAVAVTAGGERVTSASSDKTIRVWEMTSGKELAIAVLDSAPRRVAVAPDKVTIVAGDNVGNVYCLHYAKS